VEEIENAYKVSWENLLGKQICECPERDRWNFVGFEVFTAVVMKSVIFCDMKPCSPLSVNRRFGGTYRLHLHGLRNKFSKKPASRWQAGFLLNLFLRP
jgi:hypothetical protein